MPKYYTGDMWEILPATDHFIVTTNAVVKADNALVMGAGIAKQLRDRVPGIDKRFGIAVLNITNSRGEYGCLLSNPFSIFQVKHHYKSPADLGLISISTAGLQQFALENPGKRFDLNYPGIGLGGLSPAVVKPIIDTLPDNVNIWSYP